MSSVLDSGTLEYLTAGSPLPDCYRSDRGLHSLPLPGALGNDSPALCRLLTGTLLVAVGSDVRGGQARARPCLRVCIPCRALQHRGRADAGMEHSLPPPLRTRRPLPRPPPPLLPSP